MTEILIVIPEEILIRMDGLISQRNFGGIQDTWTEVRKLCEEQSKNFTKHRKKG